MSLRPGRGLLGSAGVGLLALLTFALLPQRTPHGIDSHFFVVWLETGNQSYPRHPLYLHLTGLLRQLLSPLGLSVYQALLVGSALGSALGIAALHQAARLLLPGQGALGVALGCLATPAVFHFATAVEIHGVFFGFAGLAWWAFAAWHSAPRWPRALWLGLAGGLAAAVHAFGHLLPAMFVLAAFGLRKRPRDHVAGNLLALALGHGLAALLPVLLLAAGGQAEDAVGHLQERWATLAWSSALPVLWREWLWAFLPWSLLALLGLGSPRARPWALAALGGLLLHWPLCVLLLGFHRIDERGAYLLALAPLMVLAAQALLPRHLFRMAVLLGAVLTVVQVAPRWPQPGAPGFAEGVAALRQEGPFLLVVGNGQEQDAARTQVADVVCVEVTRALGEFLTRAGSVTLEQWFDGWMQALGQAQLPVLFSESARQALEGAADPAIRALWQQHIAERYRLQPAIREGFAGTWIRP